MEIACDVLKKPLNTKILENNKDIKKKFLNISEIARTNSFETFIKVINTKKYIDSAISLIKKYFDNVDGDMGFSILMAYCISSYSDKLFGPHKTKFEQKLVLSANKLILLIEKLLMNDKVQNEYSELNSLNEEFLSTIDHYYSLYKVWKSKDSIDEMTNLFDNMQEMSSILKIQIKRKMSTNYDNLLETMNTLFELNTKYAIKIMLHNYDIFVGLQLFETKFWDNVVINYQKYKDAIFIILVAELKMQLIPLLINPLDRKELYYKLDTEDIICKIRNYELDINKIIEIINLLQNKTNKINDGYKIMKITYKLSDDELIQLFKMMFHSINNV